MTQFAGLAREGVRVRLLGDERFRDYGTRLLAAIRAWIAQFGSQRPVEARRAAAKVLHDRFIFVDKGKVAWSVGQSMRDIARTSPTAFLRVPADIAAEKVTYYEERWAASAELS